MSKSVVDQLRKRRAYPMTIGDVIIYIRAMTEGEWVTAMAFRDDDASLGYAIGKGWVLETGEAVYSQVPDETAQAFGERVLTDADLPTDTRTELAQAIVRLSQAVKPKTMDSMAKN
jgi:hypothetical protein